MELTEEFITEENKRIAKEYKKLLRISYRTLSDEDKVMIRRAFETALEAHKEQRRKSGEAYIFHPISVAQIVASEIGLDATSIAAALLHDVVEDTEYTLADLEQMFGETVAKIVDGLTKISNLKKDADISFQAENFRKMLLTLNDDIRVIIIKIADRLHNMQTMDAMRDDKQVKIASETLYIYAPLAHRIGLYNIKTQLEDLSLKYTEPEVYNDIKQKLKESEADRDDYIQSFSKIISEAIEKENIDFQLKGRTKSIYSIRKKLAVQNITFDEIYDKFAIRIIYASSPDNEKFLAWKIYSIVTDYFRPNPTRLRDWISSPKTTGYEALHITVMGPEGRWVEVQIRSERMHEIAEKGYAAHYKYKHGEDEEKGIEVWLNRLQDALENNDLNAVDFVEQFKLNLYAKEIFVFTPEGDLKSLPKGATALDFAFAIHTDLGLTTRGVKVNGKLKPLSHTLKSGDQVEVISSKTAKPNKNWLEITTTAKAKSKIKSALKVKEKQIAEEGKEILIRKLKSQRIQLNEKTETELIRFFKLQTSQDLFYRVGIGTIDNTAIKRFVNSRNNALFSFFKNKIKRGTSNQISKVDEVTQNYDQLVFGDDEDKLNYELSKCCNPIPGDEVFGFLTVNEGIKVHKKDCPNAIQLQSNYAYRILKAKWIDSSQEEFIAKLKLTGLDDVGLINEITSVISKNLGVNMQSISFNSKHGVFEGFINLKVKNKTILKKLMLELKKISGIDNITRE
ncbi:MAG: RelA/SpoT family protein [Flavobacteriaceae bacterium]|nr:RelA/SpoT family protein [Flavobacteriaceae bacterium]